MPADDAPPTGSVVDTNVVRESYDEIASAYAGARAAGALEIDLLQSFVRVIVVVHPIAVLLAQGLGLSMPGCSCLSFRFPDD